MRATGSHNAQDRLAGCVPEPRSAPRLYVLGVLIAYVAVLAFGIAASFSIQKFEAAMNIAAITGFVVVCAVSARRTVRTGVLTDSSHASIPAAREGRMISKKASQPSAERWGSVAVIGFLND